jgi:hypothetical protein
MKIPKFPEQGILLVPVILFCASFWLTDVISLRNVPLFTVVDELHHVSYVLTTHAAVLENSSVTWDYHSGCVGLNDFPFATSQVCLQLAQCSDALTVLWIVSVCAIFLFCLVYEISDAVSPLVRHFVLAFYSFCMISVFVIALQAILTLPTEHGKVGVGILLVTAFLLAVFATALTNPTLVKKHEQRQHSEMNEYL